MKSLHHANEEVLVRYLDGELPEPEFIALRSHLGLCTGCRQKQEALARLSTEVEELISSEPVDYTPGSRIALADAIRRTDKAVQIQQNSGRVLRRFGWGMAVAATLAFGILLAPKSTRTPQQRPADNPRRAAASIDVNGETFIALPYGNPDLPVNDPRIIEMSVPVSSLASAGIILQPVASDSADPTVLANVLLGIDGQPIGVHVLSTD